MQEMQVWSLGREDPKEGSSNTLQYSCLGNPMGKGAQWAIVHRVTKSQTRLSGWTTTTTSGIMQYCEVWQVHQKCIQLSVTTRTTRKDWPWYKQKWKGLFCHLSQAILGLRAGSSLTRPSGTHALFIFYSTISAERAPTAYFFPLLSENGHCPIREKALGAIGRRTCQPNPSVSL